MDSGGTSRFSGGLRTSGDTAIEESGLLGTRRGWSNINRLEIIFLLAGILAAIVTDSLTIVRLAYITDARDPDLAYGILILVNSVFLLLFLITGIIYQRITDIVAFFISAVMLTIYVIAHYIARRNTPDEQHSDKTIRLIRLVFTILFNICFVPLAIFVIQDYRRDEFSKRLFGAFPAARRPLKIYNIFDCIVRINTMLSISTFVLNLYNFNAFEPYDKVLLGIGIPLTFLWLGTGIGMVRLESRILVIAFYLISLFQPGFLGYCLYSAIEKSPGSTTAITPFITTMITTFTTTMVTTLTTTVTALTTTTITTLTTTVTVPTTTATATSSTIATSSTSSPKTLVTVPDALYVCIGTNLLAHILSMVFGFLCVRNFGKELKDRVFNNRFDKWFQKRSSDT